MQNQELKFWLAINKINLIGAIKFKFLYNYFPNMQTVWQDADTIDLMDAGIDEKTAQLFFQQKKHINPDVELEKLQTAKVEAATIMDDNYPALLKQIYSPPAVLFYKGNIEQINEYTLAVVGTRKISSYGRMQTQQIVQDLARQKISIVSGLALGVDALSHLTAIQNKTQTIAVLGSGLDEQNIYPVSNRRLANEILANNGIIISEYPVGTSPQRHHFPARNRIISGLSKGTLVIEAGEKSGALITAKFALDQNREIFAIPGNINQLNSAGTNNLIKQGANLVMSAADILEVLNLQQAGEFQINQQILPDNDDEAIILNCLKNEPTHIDLLAKSSNLPAAKLNSTLTLMELKGKIKNIGNNQYIKN